MQKEKTEQAQVAYFEIGDLMGIVMTFVVVGIGLTYGLNVQGDVKNDINATANPDAYTGAGNAISATAKFANKLGLIATVVVAAIVIGVLVRYLWVGNK